MDLRLELTLCAVQVQTQRVRRLKELCVQGKSAMHNGQWLGCVQNTISTAAVKIIAEAEWTYSRVIELLHNGTALPMCPEVQRPSRAKPVTAPVRLKSCPCLQGITRGGAPAWTLDQAVIRRAGGGQS